MFIKNATYKTISTEGQSFPIAEGTIISNGIVPQTIDIEPPTHRISVAIGGTINLNSEANKNVSFTNEQIRALGGDFNFVPAEEAKSELPSYTDADEGKVLGLAETNGTVAPAWVNGGGGGGLPEYTSEDEGKVLTVVEGTETVIPEQSVTTDTSYPDMAGAYSGLLSDVNLSGLSDTDECTFTVNGTDYTGNFVKTGTVYQFLIVDVPCGFILDEEGDCLFLSYTKDGVFMVKVTRPSSSATAEWVNVGGNAVITALDDDDVLDIVAGKLMTLFGACTDSAVHHLNPSGVSGNTTEAVYNAIKAAYDNNGAVVYQLTLGDVFYYAPTKYAVTGSNTYTLVLPVGNYGDDYNITLELSASKSGDTYTLMVGGYASAMTAVSSS